MGISTNAPTPEVGQVKYLSVLDEIADNKDTVLHVISDSLVPRPSSLVGKKKGEEGLVELIT